MTGLGAYVGNTHIAAIGQADDVALISTSPYSLILLAKLTVLYCQKYFVELVEEKTQIQIFKPSKSSSNYFELMNIFSINNTPAEIVKVAEHVGIQRGTSNNTPAIDDRIVKHRNSLYGILGAGISRNHRANPAAALRAHDTFCHPVLLSGLPALILNKDDITRIHKHHKKCLQNIQKLYDNTPDPVIFFLAGSLPGTAMLHMSMLRLFGMISRLVENPLNKIAHFALTTISKKKGSWFLQIRDLCLKYKLPEPLSLLQYPPTKTVFKTMYKAAIIVYWEKELRSHAERLDSLIYLKTHFMSLTKAHPIWTTCLSNPFEVNKAVVQARMLSGRYRTQKLRSHFSKQEDSSCKVCLSGDPETLSHILLECRNLESARTNVIHSWLKTDQPAIVNMALESLSDDMTEQFLLDCSVIPSIIAITQTFDKNIVLSALFKLTRAFCYSLHKERHKLLGLWEKL